MVEQGRPGNREATGDEDVTQIFVHLLAGALYGRPGSGLTPVDPRGYGHGDAQRHQDQAREQRRLSGFDPGHDQLAARATRKPVGSQPRVDVDHPGQGPDDA